MLSQSSASSLLRWSCAHWLKRVASVLSDVPLSVVTYIEAESWALIRVLRSAGTCPFDMVAESTVRQ